MSLQELIERIEALEGRDREVDRLVGRAVGWMHVPSGKYDWMKPNGMYCTTGLPEFTASLDAAMTLVPKGWRLRQMDFSAPCADCRKWTLNLFGGSVGQDTFHSEAWTPPLTLCAAALRARKDKTNEQ